MEVLDFIFYLTKQKGVPLTPIINALQKLPMLPSLINWQGESVLH